MAAAGALWLDSLVAIYAAVLNAYVRTATHFVM